MKPHTKKQLRSVLIVTGLVMVSACCEEGGCAVVTGYTTSRDDLDRFYVPNDFTKYYCVGYGHVLIPCNWTGDKNSPSGVRCPATAEGETGAKDFGVAGLEKLRVIKGCELNNGGDLEVVFVANGSVASRVDRNTLDTGPIDWAGQICFRSTTGASVSVESYLANLECGGTPSSETIGGVERSCSTQQCGDGSFCPGSGECTQCEYNETCLYPGQTCSTTCGVGECDRTATCVRCGVFNPYELCLAPGEVCP